MNIIYIALTLGLLTAVFTLIFRMHQELREARVIQKNVSTEIENLKSQLNTLMSCSVGMGHRLGDFQGKLNGVSQRQNVLKMQKVSNDTNYGHALSLLRKGASEDELIETCGISRGEAQLMSRLQPQH